MANSHNLLRISSSIKILARKKEKISGFLASEPLNISETQKTVEKRWV